MLNPTSNRDPRPPQDSTIFIASLPLQFDQQELAGYLKTHLSKFAQIHNVNVVRDNNGATCAFVQCHSSSDAALLIKSVQETEFFGRILRAEPARALRTLLISYRSPRQDSHPHQPILDLPTSIKLFRPKTSKFYTITYNEQPTEAATDELFISPPSFSGKELEDLVSFFGPLEDFKPLDRPCPYPHNAPRSPTMDPRCYEIKWVYREDCVAALTTLKRVPHLTITWSHQRRALHPDATRPNPITTIPWSENDFPPLAGGGGTKPVQGVWDRPRFKPEIAEAELSISSDMSLETVSSAPSVERVTSGQCADYATTYTPSLATSPITPVTPPNHQLVTPIDPPHIDFGRLSLSKSDNYFSNPSQVHDTRPTPTSPNIDPLSIFIGGLNVHGPTAWTEERVVESFSRFGTIQVVKFLHPAGQRTAFAFVTYESSEAAIRAVQEEHNQIYNNRPIRVQLREVNPTRSPWKSQRNRERALEYRSPSGSPIKDTSITSLRENTTVQLTASPEEIEASSPEPPIGDTSHFREWYEIEPTPTLPSTTMPASTAPYPGSGYPIPPWMQFPPHFQYPMGFYPSYPPLPLHPSMYHTATVDNSGVSGTPHTPVSWIHYPGLVHSPPIPVPTGPESYIPQYHAEVTSSTAGAAALSHPSPAPSSDRSSSATPQHPPMPMGWQSFKQVPALTHPHAPNAPWAAPPLAPPFTGTSRGTSASQTHQSQSQSGRGELYNRRRMSMQNFSHGGARGRGRVHNPGRMTPGRNSMYISPASGEIHWVPGT